MSEWKVREMSALLEEIRYMRKRMQVIYEACGASCGNSVHIHRCMAPESQEHEAHICEDCGYEWTQTEAALRVPGRPASETTIVWLTDASVHDTMRRRQRKR